MKKITFVLAFSLLLAACGSEDSSNDKELVEEKPTQEANTASTNNEANKGETKEEVAPSNKENGDTTLYAESIKLDVPSMTENQAELTQESYDFIVENFELLPAKEEAAINSVKKQAQEVDLKLLNKNLAPYYSTFVTYEGYVIQIEEQNFENGETVSWLNIYDEVAGTNHNVLMYKTSGDILEEDYVQFWGIPLAKYSYGTVDGGFQNTILFVASHAEKK